MRRSQRHHSNSCQCTHVHLSPTTTRKSTEQLPTKRTCVKRFSSGSNRIPSGPCDSDYQRHYRDNNVMENEKRNCPGTAIEGKFSETEHTPTYCFSFSAWRHFCDRFFFFFFSVWFSGFTKTFILARQVFLLFLCFIIVYLFIYFPHVLDENAIINQPPR